MPGVQSVSDFDELVSTPFSGEVNALCWQRPLEGDFEQLLAKVPAGDSLTAVEPEELQALDLDASGRRAAEILIDDFQRLQELGRQPELNRIDGYLRDGTGSPIPTDLFSFHADSAPVEGDTFLCTYAGAPSEFVGNGDVIRKLDLPEVRRALLTWYGGEDDEGFEQFISENGYDLHYQLKPQAGVFSFGLGHLWRIAIQHPGARVPPCVHRAPETRQPRLLLIS